MRKTHSQKIALCGVLAALSVVVLLAGAALQIGTYAAPMLAAFLVVPVLEEYGTKYALLLYGTVSLLALILVPETELAWFYLLVVGHYPVLRRVLARVQPATLRLALKLLFFNGAVVVLYTLLAALLGPALWQELTADGTTVLGLLLAMGNLSFFLCDRALGAVTLYYRRVLRKKIRRFL